MNTNLPTGSVSTVLSAARGQLGVPYHWGWAKPGQGFDCSGLTSWAFAQAGVKIPRTSLMQSATGQSISRANLQPGDLVFPEFPIHHVQIYTGNGNIIESPQTGETVVERPMWGFFSARRVMADSGGTQGFIDPSNPVGAGVAVASAAAGLNPLSVLGLPSFSSLLANSRHFMLRVVEVILGGALIIAAASKLASSSSTVRTVAKAVK